MCDRGTTQLYKAMIWLSLHIVVRAWCHISVYCEMIACAAWPSCYYCQEVSTYCMFSWNSFCLSNLGKVPSHHRENFFLNYKFTQGLLYATVWCFIGWGFLNCLNVGLFISNTRNCSTLTKVLMYFFLVLHTILQMFLFVFGEKRMWSQGPKLFLKWSEIHKKNVTII